MRHRIHSACNIDGVYVCVIYAYFGFVLFLNARTAAARFEYFNFVSFRRMQQLMMMLVVGTWWSWIGHTSWRQFTCHLGPINHALCVFVVYLLCVRVWVHVRRMVFYWIQYIVCLDTHHLILHERESVLNYFFVVALAKCKSETTNVVTAYLFFL